MNRIFYSNHWQTNLILAIFLALFLSPVWLPILIWLMRTGFCK